MAAPLEEYQDGRFDLVRVLAEKLDFYPMVHEHVLPLPSTLSEGLVDTYLTLCGRLAPLNPNGVPTGCHDVRLYLNDLDVTNTYVELVRRAIGKRREESRQEYRQALDAWLSMLDAAPGNYQVDLAAEKLAANKLCSTERLEDALDMLGNYEAGFSGHLHLFNFLYTHIRIAPISVVTVVGRHNSTTGGELDASDVRSITLACGPCRLYETAWTFSLARGGLYLMVETRHHNPLLDRLERLEAQVAELKTTIEEGLEEIAAATGPEGHIQTRLNRANQSLSRLTSQATSIDVRAEGQSRELTALRHQIEALSASL